MKAIDVNYKRLEDMMKKLFTILVITIIICSGCSSDPNGENQKENSQTEVTESLVTKNQTDEDNLTADANTSDGTIDYGSTADEFLTSTPIDGMVTNLTDSSFVTQPAFVTGNSESGSSTNVVYDSENVSIKTALVKADGSSFSISDGQLTDLVENVSVLVYGSAQNDGTFEAIEIIVVEFDYN